MRAIVTGASRGIGRAISEELARAGYDLLLVSRNTLALSDARSSIATLTGRKVDAYPCDLSIKDEIRSLVEYERTMPEPLNVLVLNAGVYLEADLDSLPEAVMEDTLAVNLVSAYYCVNSFLPRLREGRNAKIIFIGSTASLEAYSVGPLYSVSKWALRGYAKNLRQELIKDNIGVTIINPGGTMTDLWAGENLPPDRLLTPTDIAHLVVAVLSLSPQAVVEEIVVRPMLGDMH